MMFGGQIEQSRDERVRCVILNQVMRQNSGRLVKIVRSDPAATKVVDNRRKVLLLIAEGRWNAPSDWGGVSIRLPQPLSRAFRRPRPFPRYPADAVAGQEREEAGIEAVPRRNKDAEILPAEAFSEQ